MRPTTGQYKRIAIAFGLSTIAVLIVAISASLVKTTNCATITTKSICLETVSSQTDQQIGMSKYTTYSCGRGMLFDFGSPGYYSIWMKDTKFPLDISWLDANKTVVKVEKNVSPDTYPKTFTSVQPASYVLETYPGCYELNVGSKLTN